MTEVENNTGNNAADAGNTAAAGTTPITFHFKARTIRDEAGNAIAKSKKQPSMTVGIKMPTSGELVEVLLAGGKEADLVLAGVQQLIYQQARAQLDEVIESFGNDAEKVVTANDLDHSKLTLEFIASIPPTQRGGAAISDEEWLAWYQHYTEVMAEATGKDASKLAKHVDIFKSPQRYKTNKEVLTVMLEQLQVYAATAGADALEEHGQCVDRIASKFEKWLNAEEKQVDLLALI